MRKFVLLGHARSGSSLLALAIGQHPDVEMHGEVFANAKNPPEGKIKGKEQYAAGRDAAEYLESFFVQQRCGWPLAMGIKLFYNHARDETAAERAWEWLAAHRDVHIIQLKRANLLESWVSLEIAKRTGEWLRPVGTPASTPSVVFAADPEGCAWFFEAVNADAARAEQVFAAHSRLEVEYEQDLCADFEGTMARIWRLLALREYPTKPLIAKQRQSRIREHISNYEELEAYFAATEYSRYFE